MSHPPEPPTEPEPSHAEIRAALERVLTSRTLGAARQLQAFLRFVVERKLAGDEARLKEYTIGTEVLGRGPGFDPKEDGVVRVQAGLLRKKLAAYYEGEGRAERLVIEVPKGAYVPSFGRRPDAPGAAPEPARAAGAEPGDAAERARRLRRIVVGVAVFDALLVGGLVAFFVLRDARGGAAGGAGPSAASAPGGGSGPPRALAEPSPWAGFFAAEAPTILAFGTPQFFEAEGVLLRDTQVNTPDAAITPRLRAVEKALGKPLEPSEVYTGIGETTGAVMIAQFFARHGRELRVLRSRHLGWDDVKDAHLVFIASLRFRTRADDLGLPGDFVFSPEGRGGILNRRPAPGEPDRYDADPGADLATVTAAPGKTPGRRVLVLGGRNTWGTQGAAEYLTRPEHLADLAARLEACRARAGRPRHAEAFQVLLRVEIADGQPLAVTYVTHHDF